jgi:hypothetical protein
MAVNTKITVIWDVTACNLLEGYHSFRGTCCLHIQGGRVSTQSSFFPKDENNRFLQNIGTLLPDYMVQYPRNARG